MSRYNSASGGGSKDDISISLPKYIYGVTGHELNIYFDNILDGENINNYRIDVVCTQGQQFAERYSLTPVAAGDTAITINVYRGHTNKLITKATSTIRVALETDPVSKSIKAMYIGDSNTASGTYVDELVSLFASDSGGSTLTTVGTLTTSGGNKHEGRGGWTTDKYLTTASYNSATNAFWNGSAFDFTYYMTNTGVARPDFVITQLGTNDAFGTPFGFTPTDLITK